VPGTLRWGILGPGGIASAQTTDLLGNGFTVAAVGSRSLDRAEEFAGRFGIPTAYGSYAELVADPALDVIYVATPHSAHYDDARLALEAGKHVLLEKPFTVTERQAAVLVELAASSGLVILEAMWTRYLPHMLRLREIIAAGTIGDVRIVIADHSQKLPSDPGHRINDPELAGGALLDLGIYPVSFAWDIFGQPTSVLASSTPTATGVDAETHILLGFDGGGHAVLSCSLDTAGPNTASVIGTDGWIELDSVWYAPTGFTVYSSDGTVVERFDETVNTRGMQFQAAELERLAEERAVAGTILPPAESALIMGTLDEIRRQIGLEYPPQILGT